jgi:hypothetical protein
LRSLIGKFTKIFVFILSGLRFKGYKRFCLENESLLFEYDGDNTFVQRIELSHRFLLI